MKIQSLFKTLILAASLALGSVAFADAKIMNPGETIGQLVFLTGADVQTKSKKYLSLTALSIPVFEELPYQLSVIGGAITLKQQNLISHVQLKCRAAHRPNLDISGLERGLENPLISQFQDGQWVRMVLDPKAEKPIDITASTQELAMEFYEKSLASMKETIPGADVKTAKIFRTEELSWKDNLIVGSKAANYAELAKALNTPERTVVRPGFAIPFAYYDRFITCRNEAGKIIKCEDLNQRKLQTMIEDITTDFLMEDIADVNYRQERLVELQTLINLPTVSIDPSFLNELVDIFDQVKDKNGLPRKMKLRSSTNSEDLPNFNGAGLYDSESYKPVSKKGREKTREEKLESLTATIRYVWSSIWNQRAYDERTAFRINHAAVRMAMQVNPSFATEEADGVVVTKNVLGDSKYPGKAVYIETQRGDTHGVANPLPGVSPMKILVQIDEKNPLNKEAYKIHVLQSSNVADNNEDVIKDGVNPNPVITDEEIKDLCYQVLKAEAHFKPLLGADKDDFALDLEFKVDSEDTGKRQVYLKQARPYID